MRAAEQPAEELRLGGLLLGCGLMLLALRMGKPLGGGLAEEDSAELAISTAISASVLALTAYDHGAKIGLLRWAAAEEHANDVGVTALVLQALLS